MCSSVLKKNQNLKNVNEIINDPKNIYRQYIKVRNIKDDQQQIEANSQKNKN